MGGGSPSAKAAPATLIVTGNPNVGKSVLFQHLTGRYATVSNYPGTTVMVSRGTAVLGGHHREVCDTPGINSLLASSEDELVARDVLLGEPDATVLQVGDAKNLLRALVLTLELAEAGVPTVLALNMIDEAKARRIVTKLSLLGDLLDIPVIPTVATEGWGIDRLRRAIPRARRAIAVVRYPAVIEEALRQMEPLLPEAGAARRAIALLWLAGDRAILEAYRPRLDVERAATIERIVADTQARASTPLGVLITQTRLREAQRLATLVASPASMERRPWLRRLGDWAMHPVWGLLGLAVVLSIMYVLVGDVAAQRGVGFLEDVVFGRYLVPACRATVQLLLPWPAAQALLIGEYGLLTMALPYAFAIILPIVTMFFLCFGFLEDVGYLPRLAVMANRFCRLLGLNGKAVLPLVLGLGCGTMATMTTRILDSKRDRILVTLLLALGIPCSAQLGVIMAMLAGRPPLALGIWAGMVLALLILVGQLAARVIPGEASLFLYELPPMRWPKLSNVLVKTLGRVEWYVKEAVPLFFLGTLVLFLLHVTGLLGWLERVCAPVVVTWLGLPPAATAALLVGFLRRDFGAAGFFSLQRNGQLDGAQTVVSLVTITLFMPCIAQYFMMLKERGWRWANLIALVVTVTAITVGGVLLRVLHGLRLTL